MAVILIASKRSTLGAIPEQLTGTTENRHACGITRQNERRKISGREESQHHSLCASSEMGSVRVQITGLTGNDFNFKPAGQFAIQREEEVVTEP